MLLFLFCIRQIPLDGGGFHGRERTDSQKRHAGQRDRQTLRVLVFARSRKVCSFSPNQGELPLRTYYGGGGTASCNLENHSQFVSGNEITPLCFPFD